MLQFFVALMPPTGGLSISIKIVFVTNPTFESWSNSIDTWLPT